MKPKLSEKEARLAQVKRGLDQISEGTYSFLPATDDKEMAVLFGSFDKMARAVSEREGALRRENVQLAASVGRIEKLLDVTIDGIAFIGQDTVFRFVNRRFCEILGLRPGALNRKTVQEACSLWQQALVDPDRLVRVLVPVPHDKDDGTHDVIDDVVEFSGGERRYARVYGAPVLDDDGVYAGRIISLHDNTREIELDRLKTEFISVVSHELRTPLTSIKGYTDLMLSGATGELNEVQREFLGILQSSANRLGNLINDILDLSRIDGGRIQVKHEAVDYIAIVGDLMRLMKASADEKEISLDVSFPQNLPMVAGDQDKISQVVSNLLSNAIKYTPAGGWIKVLVEVTGDSTVRTCVADSGIGISPADQKKLFQKFFRADNSLTREAGGTGLGLVIVKSIIEMLGGTIWVQSEPDRGSKFFYTLPLFIDRNQVDSGGLPFVIPDRGVGLVLLAESNSYVRENVQHSLHRRGFGVVTASSPEEALQKARQHKPEIVLLDVMMDECRGFNVLKSLREDPASKLLPIIAFSMQEEGTNDRIALGPVSFGTRSNVEALLIKSLSGFEESTKRNASILVVNLRPEAKPASEATAGRLADANLLVEVVDGAGEAIMSIVAKQPDAVLIDAEDAEEGRLFGLLKTIKSEVDFARIPVVFITSDFDTEGIHFHLGDGLADVRPAVDYVCEQVAVVMRANSYRISIDDSKQEEPESGILIDN